MTDIDAYVEFNKYIKFQHCRPDYNDAISTSLKFAKKYVKGNDVIIGDFCCGTGSNTKMFADFSGRVRKALLIDINKGFLEIAQKSNIKAKDIIVHHSDILDVQFQKECNLVFSVFAYHHIMDTKKTKYISQITNCLKKGGILIVAEIYFENKNQCVMYYDKLYKSIPKDKRISGLDTFLQQTAKSDDFEFKVSKKFADTQFKQYGFKLIDELKIWPKDSTSEIGTFVQVYQL